MAENNQYWNQMISKGLRLLQEQNNDAAAAVLKKASFEVEHTYHDSWRWGTDYWALILYLKYSDYTALGEKKEQVEKDIMSALVTLQKGSRDLLSTVSIRQSAEQEIDVEEVLPLKKATEAAELFICGGSYDAAFDCIQIAFSDYCTHIQPADAGDITKTILQNVGDIISSINELKNSNTAAHSDGQRIGKREAQLAINLANSIVDYIEDVENN